VGGNSEIKVVDSLLFVYIPASINVLPRLLL